LPIKIDQTLKIKLENSQQPKNWIDGTLPNLPIEENDSISKNDEISIDTIDKSQFVVDGDKPHYSNPANNNYCVRFFARIVNWVLDSLNGIGFFAQSDQSIVDCVLNKLSGICNYRFLH